MKTVIVFLMLCLVVEVNAQTPVPGSLCDGVGPAGVEDFWEKWEAADLVLYALPTLKNNSAIGMVIVSPSSPPVISEKFELRSLQVWKGPVSVPPLEVVTSWDFVLWDCGSPPGYCIYKPESCALVVETAVAQVFFLKSNKNQWETFTSFGTGVYDLEWLEAEVGEPVAVESRNWGSHKATFR